METEQIRCQKCLAINPFRQEYCRRCGTRLMLVVATPAQRFEEQTLSEAHSEHLLERVSTLENQLMRVIDRVEQTLNLLLRQTNTSSSTFILLQTLIDVLGEAGNLDRVELITRWREAVAKDGIDTNEDEAEALAQESAGAIKPEADDFEQWCKRITEACYGTRAIAAADLIRKGFLHSLRADYDHALSALEKAAKFVPDNQPLNFLLGQHFYQAGKQKQAREYLTRAAEAATSDPKVDVLLGTLDAEAGDGDKAKFLFTRAAQHDATAFIAHYALGRLAAIEKDWANAIEEWKRAFAVRQAAEILYVLGVAYFHLSDDALAERNLRQAVELDKDFGQAWCWLVILHDGRDDAAATSEALGELKRICPNPQPSAPLEMPVKRERVIAEAMKMLFGSVPTRRLKRKLLTNGDARLAQMFISDVRAQLDPVLTQIFGRL